MLNIVSFALVALFVGAAAVQWHRGEKASAVVDVGFAVAMLGLAISGVLS